MEKQSQSGAPVSTGALTEASSVERVARDAYDVVVVGGGPAGCAAASIAAQGGVSVLLLERHPEPVFKIGESLMPETYWTLEKMGALERVRSSGFVEKHSVQFFGKSGKASAPFYFDSMNDHESSRTWQVHRARFDQLLLETSAEQGAEVHRGLSVRRVEFEDGKAEGVVIRDGDGGERRVGARVVVDATGQGSLVAREREVPREDYRLRNASIFTHFRGAIRDPGRDEGATIILHTRDGDSWFWYIPLADDVVSIGVVGPQDSLITERETRPHETFFEEVAKCPEIERRIAPAMQCRPIQVLKDFSYRSTELAGDGWVLVGDAFSFIDPVYSSGVFLALKSGEMAAEAILEGLEAGDVSGERLGSFQDELHRGMEAVLGLVRSFYEPNFSFGGFLREYPQHREDVTRILVGDVFERDFSDFFASVQEYQSAGADRRAAQA